MMCLRAACRGIRGSSRPSLYSHRAMAAAMGSIGQRLCSLCALFTVLAGVGLGGVSSAVVDNGNSNLAAPVSSGSEDYLIKQVVWKKCHRKLTPACLKLSLVRTVEMMSKDSSFVLAPGVTFSSNSSEFVGLPSELARSLSQDQPPIDELVTFSLGRYVRSLTLNVNLVDFFSGGNETVQNSVMEVFSGRGKGGFGGYGGLAAVLGGSLASMMLAALAALSGKALMTSMAALMMSAMAAMKGGGGGGGEHKTYEVITKPIVSHINTHSSEVQHEHGHHGHYRKRSLERGVVEEGKWGLEPYLVYSAYEDDMGVDHRDKKSLEPEEKPSQTPPETVNDYKQPESEESAEKDTEGGITSSKTTDDDHSVLEKESTRRKRSVLETDKLTQGDKDETMKKVKENLQSILNRYPRRERSTEEQKIKKPQSTNTHYILNQPVNNLKVKTSLDVKQQDVHRSVRSITKGSLSDSNIYHIRMRPEGEKIASGLPLVSHLSGPHTVHKRFALNVPVKSLRYIR